MKAYTAIGGELSHNCSYYSLDTGIMTEAFRALAVEAYPRVQHELRDYKAYTSRFPTYREGRKR
jgi:hypothetical protein